MPESSHLSSSPTPSLRVLSLFSGAGGMDLGLEQAGFELIAGFELDAKARETLRLNRPDWPIWNDGDVIAAAQTLHPSYFGLVPGELELIAGGPPCQPFSAAGQWAAGGRQGMNDERAGTVHALLDLFERFQPKMVLLENVQGFLSGVNSALPAIERRVTEVNETYGLNYSLRWRVVNAADYGVPQNRKRAIIIIHAGDTKWEWPNLTHENEPITAWDALHDLEEDTSNIPILQGKWSSLLASIPEGHNYQWLTSEGGGEEIFGYRTRYWNFLLKLAKDRPSWTLPASPGPSAGPFHWDNRPLSIRERMRLQSFPDDWRLAGGFRDQVKLVGNATPPLLAEHFGRRVAASLRGELHGGSSAELSLLRAPASVRPKPGTTMPIPDEYRIMIGPRAPHAGTGKGPAPRVREVSSLTASEETTV